MAEVIKAPAATGRVADERVAREVSEMLLRIERDGEAAVREYSRRLDRWDPPSSIMTVLVAKTAGVGHVVTATPGRWRAAAGSDAARDRHVRRRRGAVPRRRAGTGRRWRSGLCGPAHRL